MKYDAGHISIETGLQDDSIRTKLRPYLTNPFVEDEELIHQLNVAVSAEEERIKKLKNQSKRKPSIVSQIGQESPESTKVPSGKVPASKEDPKTPDSTQSKLQELKAILEALET